jgi:hypothetical protein
MSVAATSKRSPIARLRRESCGRPSWSRSQAPASVKTAKLVTRPTTIARGRQRPPPTAHPAGRIGSTGRTHGEMAVIRPARNPTPTRTAML